MALGPSFIQPYTFDEAMASLTKHGRSAFAPATVVITQDDSRTAWGRGRLYRYADDRLGNGAHVLDLKDSFSLMFSDRQWFFDQSFTVFQPDRVGLDIVKVGANRFRGDFYLFNWNSAYSVDLEPASQGKLLIGYGKTIGWGPQAALYCVSIQGITLPSSWE
jgi:hypothetical protein